MPEVIEQPRKSTARRIGLILFVPAAVGLLLGVLVLAGLPPFAGLTNSQSQSEGRDSVSTIATPTVTSSIGTSPTVEPSPPARTTPLATPRSAAQLSTAEQKWKRINDLWPEGDRGDIEALQEIQLLLRDLLRESPQDRTVSEKLAVAQLNLDYRQRMKEIDFYWSSCNTSSPTIASCAFAVEALEALRSQSLPPAYWDNVKKRLYDAHMSYGRALQSVKRDYEAQGQYQRAMEIDPSRPEAKQALEKPR